MPYSATEPSSYETIPGGAVAIGDTVSLQWGLGTGRHEPHWVVVTGIETFTLSGQTFTELSYIEYGSMVSLTNTFARAVTPDPDEEA